jgi:hypothetical protein
MRMSMSRFTRLTNSFSRRLRTTAMPLHCISFSTGNGRGPIEYGSACSTQGRLRRLWFEDPKRKRLMQFQTETLPKNPPG